MQNLMFDSDNLGATEEFLNSAYTQMSIGNDSPTGVRTRVRREVLGQVSLDVLDLGFDMSYDADPLNKVCLATVHSGALEEHDPATGDTVFGPGECGLLTPPDQPYRGVIRSARYSITMFDPALLDRVAAADHKTPLRFSGDRPATRAAATRLTGVIEHLRLLATDPDAVANELIVATATDYLAATVLSAIPTTAVLEPTAGDRCDAHPETVRRALAYIDAHLAEDISVTDIAAAAFVTPRALQLAFRRHLDTTPFARLRRARLAAAHDQLRAADPACGITVTDVAYRWGFTHPGRFAAAYRLAYHHSPSDTLNA